MNTFVQIELFNSSERVNYYTVRYLNGNYEGQEFSEAEKFLNRFNDKSHVYYEEFATILKLVQIIGENGALDHYFRKERLAVALPSYRGKVEEIQIVKDSQLRWYMMVVSESIVVLFNGGVKTVRGAEFCPQVGPYFNAANSFCKMIEEYILKEDIIVSTSQLISGYRDDEDIILYL